MSWDCCNAVIKVFSSSCFIGKVSILLLSGHLYAFIVWQYSFDCCLYSLYHGWMKETIAVNIQITFSGHALLCLFDAEFERK